MKALGKPVVKCFTCQPTREFIDFKAFQAHVRASHAGTRADEINGRPARVSHQFPRKAEPTLPNLAAASDLRAAEARAAFARGTNSNSPPKEASPMPKDRAVLMIDFTTPSEGLNCSKCHCPGAIPLTGMCTECDPLPRAGRSLSKTPTAPDAKSDGEGAQGREDDAVSRAWLDYFGGAGYGSGMYGA